MDKLKINKVPSEGKCSDCARYEKQIFQIKEDVHNSRR